MRIVTITDEYITLGQLLKKTDCISTGGEAKPFLEQFTVKVNGEPEARRGRKLYFDDVVEVDSHGTFKVGKKL